MNIHTFFIIAALLLTSLANAPIMAADLTGQTRSDNSPKPVAREVDWKKMMTVAERKRDAQGGLLSLQSYDETIHRGMEFLLQDHLKWFKGPPATLLDEQGNTQMPWVYYSNLQQDGTPFAGAVDGFVSYPAFHHALLIRTFIGYSKYANDQRSLKEAVKLADWNIAHSTPADWPYGSLPWSTFQEKKPGGFRDATGLMPDKASIMGLAYLQLFEATGEKRFLQAADAIARTLVARQRHNGTWPFRVDPRTQAVIEEYTSSVIYAVRLFESLDKLNGNDRYRANRDKTWNWLVNGPIKTKEFRGFYEDIPASKDGRTNYDCLDTIRYLLANRTAENGYLEMAKDLNAWVEKTFMDKIKGFEPAEGIREQLQCNVVMGIHSLNWASMLLDLAKATGDEQLLQRACQTANYITYYLQHDNRIVVGFQYNQWWYSCHAGPILYLFDFVHRAGQEGRPPMEAWKSELLKQPLRAYCIDFNWLVDGKHVFPEPGHWADADPAAHVKWYKDIGANCIQTFVLSCNGYAWYKGSPIPEQPGLRSNFLSEVVRLGHEQRMLVMGYYCIAANSLWGQRHPEQSYGTPSSMHIPLTKDYIDYLCVSVEDALKKTGIDGFMLDWMQNTSGKWLDCEKRMYTELMGVPFPGADKITPSDKKKFDDLAVERCWTRIRDTARKVKPDCILWPNGLHHLKLEGVDWLLNEGPDVQATETARQQLNGRPIRLIQNQVGWSKHDARKVFSNPRYQSWDFYGFAAPYDNSLPLPVAEYLQRPMDDFKGTDAMTINDRNIAALIRFYLDKPVEPPPPAVPSQSKEQEVSSAARFKWFHEAKYGLFINWGLYSIPAGEWKGKKYPNIGEWIMYDAKIPVREYEQLAVQFNPIKFNADEWAQLAVDAGMKYLVFDCKHHDGFALYHSEVSKYNCYDATPWRRDPFRELQQACDKRGVKLCFYYSQATDWHEPNGANNDWYFPPNPQKDFDQYFRDKSMPQVRELLTNYGSIGLIWFDVPTLMTPVRCQQLVDLVRSLQPETLINSRLGPGGLQDYQSRGDNEIPHTVTPGVWETAATINDTWGYKKNDQNWKTPAEVCFKLVDIVSKGGNYLLNVGPDADGQIPPPSQEVLRKVGVWLKTNGEAIYGAGRTPFGSELGTPMPGPKDKRGQPPFDLKRDWRCTTRPGKIYLHLFRWPATGKFEVPGLQSKVNKAYLLTDRRELKMEQTPGGVSLSLPAGAPDTIASVICLEIVDQVARGAEQK